MVEQGYTSGEGWDLDVTESVGQDDLAMEVIARLIKEGFTSGYDPQWILTVYES